MNKSLQDAIIKAKQDPNGLSDADLEFIYQQGKKDAIDEAEAKVKEYASIWMSYNDGMTKEQIAQEALNCAKESMIRILKQIKEKKNE